MSEMINAFSLNADGGQMLNQCHLGCGSFSFLLLKKYQISTMHTTQSSPIVTK